MKRRLLLISPSLTHPGHHRSINVAGWATMEPLALACLAALTPPHWEVRIVDEVMEQVPGNYHPDLVAITSFTPTAARSYAIAAEFHARGIPVVMGGIHATLCPEEAALHVDSVFCGEAEGAWPQVIDDFENGRLRPRYQGNLSDLSNLPIPRRDLYCHRYHVSLVTASRGCRHRCEFCAIWKYEAGRYRARPIEDVLRELPHVPCTYITFFTDDNIMTDRDYSLSLFREMANRGLQRRHAVQASLDVADDDELLKALKASGCFVVVIGLESLSEGSLRTMRKVVNLHVGVDHYREKINRLHAHGLMIAACFIFGCDGDSPEIFHRTARFVIDAGVDLAHFGLLIPTPGTDVFSRLKREGRLRMVNFPEDYALYDLNHPVFIPHLMSPPALKTGLEAATRDIARWPVALRRAYRTWRDTGDLNAAVISLLWTRTGLHRRVFGVT